MDNSYNGMLITPPEKQEKLERKTYVCIDSRDRNHDKFPDSSKYTINLREEVKDVTRIELTGGSIPSSDYHINEHNNKLHFSENKIDFIAEIPIGNYNGIDKQYSKSTWRIFCFCGRRRKNKRRK